MRVREYTAEDLEALRKIHDAQGFGYALPDLSNPLFATKLILADENGAPPGACPDEVGRAASVPLNEEAASQDAGLQPGATQERVLGAALLRLTAEAYLLLDPREGTP